MRTTVRRSFRSRHVPVALVVLAACAPADPETPTPVVDPRVYLAPGWRDAGVAARGLELVAHVDRPAAFTDRNDLGNLLLGNSDMAFRDTHLFLGSFHGFNIYDISNPASPRLRTSFVCPGGQGDPSVYRDLLFISVEMPNARVDCGTEPPRGLADPNRFRGVRIFDIGDLDNPRQIAAVQTCRGSHTHTLVTDPDDPDNVYIYVSGTSQVRPAEELAGCSAGAPDRDPNTALFRIEVIQVPLAAPQDARVIGAPRIFADPATGDVAGLWPGGRQAPGAQETAPTDQCHDITAYPDVGLGAGACSGNGILLDVSNAAEPVRVDEVFDPNFAYWHSATFNNDATTVIFTDEWGGGSEARCLASDRREWGANAIFTIRDRRMQLAGYYKLPAPQSRTENCVAHNGSVIPVPGRDIMVQAWYQGGVSVFDFTDPSNPFEIAYFDRGPYSGSQLLLGGFWSTYWYNGYIYGSEIGRGLDVFRLTPGEHLTQNEIDAANLVRLDHFNAQQQTRITWPPGVVVARALLDQLRRNEPPPGTRTAALAVHLERAEQLSGAERRDALRRLADMAEGISSVSLADARRLALFAETLRGLADR